MNKKITEIHESLAKALNALPGVFSSVQWGGRAYKLPGPGSRGKKKPVLLTHVCLNKAQDAVCLGCRLEKTRAKAIIKQHDWIKVNSFGSLGKNGWIETEVRTKAQCKVMISLLHESHMLHPMSDGEANKGKKLVRSRKRGEDDQGDPVARRLDSVLRQKREQGWKPAPADAFDVEQ